MKATIDMAREAGAMFDHMMWLERDLLPVFQRFEALVRADQREIDAKVCDDKHDTWRWDDEADSASGPRDCAAAIRNRGNT
jgi:hypothetical protein